MIGGGPLQLIPAIRTHFPAFHRWLGRSYLLAAVAGSVAGLFMILSRGSVLLAFTAVMAVGVFAATMSLWLPRL